jgi:Transglycosylase SLT domain
MRGGSVRALAAAVVALGLMASACQPKASSTTGPSPSTVRGWASSTPPTPAATPAASAGATTLPAPNASVPAEPSTLAAALASTTEALHRAIERWTTLRTTTTIAPPDSVVLLALYQQRIYGVMVARPGLARRTIALLPRSVAGQANANTRAGAALSSITGPIRPTTKFRTGSPEAAGVLLRSFREAQRRFGVRWEVLASVMFVESKFGRTRSASGAGAQGPMQFLPSTWAAYGMGGNIQDPRDAILGAANYLHRSGAPANYRAALYAYNRSTAYVDAILLFAGQMERDPRNYYAYYNWQVFVRTTEGVRRVTGPGL